MLRHRRLRANARASFCRYPRPVRDFRCTKSPNQVFVWSDLTEHVPNMSPKAIALTIRSYDFHEHTFFTRTSEKRATFAFPVIENARDDDHDVPRLRRVQDSGGVAARARSARVPQAATRGGRDPVAVPPERASGEGAGRSLERFRPCEATSPSQKQKTWLEPSTTRARAFPGLRLRVRTETHRGTARGGARRCLDGFSV